MSQKSKLDTGSKETVLVRQAVPKYNFIARKLPKEPSQTGSSELAASSSEHIGTASTQTTLSNASYVNNFSLKTDSQKQKPVAVVGASLQTPLTSDAAKGTLKTSTAPQTYASASRSNHYSTTNLEFSRNNDSDKNDNWNSPTEGVSLNHPVDASHCAPLTMSLSKSTTINNKSSMVTETTNQISAASVRFLQKETVNLASDDHFRYDEHLRKLEIERDIFKKDLEVQLQVNSELKRLLIASVGDDLSQRVERLCRDRAQLSLDLGGFNKKMSEEYENLDKVSIQADMWRSKYLASRVMIEELGNARAFFTLQCHDAQDALQQMLNERHELRTNLLEVHRLLQHVKSAFDPLNSQRSSTLRSTNVLDLSRSCQQLAEAMRFRLLPAHVAINLDIEADDSLWADSVTHAEQFANDVLSRPIEPPGSIQSGSSRLLPLTASPESPQVTRFHPHTRHENLTYNCCAMCKGEINVI
uniref:Golgin-45 n=1 Tax=Arion vulgaris TaxID=1028688 RepID=A0A0B6ZXQ2_9EUPU